MLRHLHKQAKDELHSQQLKKNMAAADAEVSSSRCSSGRCSSLCSSIMLHSQQLKKNMAAADVEVDSCWCSSSRCSNCQMTVCRLVNHLGM